MESDEPVNKAHGIGIWCTKAITPTIRPVAIGPFKAEYISLVTW